MDSMDRGLIALALFFGLPALGCIWIAIKELMEEAKQERRYHAFRATGLKPKYRCEKCSKAEGKVVYHESENDLTLVELASRDWSPAPRRHECHSHEDDDADIFYSR